MKALSGLVQNARPGLRFFGPLPASGSTGPCSGPSTLINVVGKRNLNGFIVNLRWRSERDTLDQRWSTFMVLNKAQVEPEADKGTKKRSPAAHPWSQWPAGCRAVVAAASALIGHTRVKSQARRAASLYILIMGALRSFSTA